MLNQVKKMGLFRIEYELVLHAMSFIACLLLMIQLLLHLIHKASLNECLALLQRVLDATLVLRALKFRWNHDASGDLLGCRVRINRLLMLQYVQGVVHYLGRLVLFFVLLVVFSFEADD